MDDLVKRLRDEDPECGLRHSLAMEAADRIEQLEAALRDVIDAWDWWQVDTYDRCGSVPDDAIRNARAALGEKKDV